MSSDSSALEWHDDQVINGIRVRAYFFDGDAVEKIEDNAKRVLPVLKQARPVLLATEDDKKNYVYGELIAQPDSVYSHGNGLIALEYKWKNRQIHDPNRWTKQLHTNSMLQCIAAAMAVAGNLGKPTVPMMRFHNANYLLSPRKEVIEILSTQTTAAREYWASQSESRSGTLERRVDRRVNATQLAEFCEPRIKREFSAIDKKSSDAGMKNHSEMLRR